MQKKITPWPSWGNFSLPRGEKIFGIRKKSSSLWVDIPSDILLNFAQKLSKISSSSESLERARVEAEKLVERVNRELRDRGFDFVKISRPRNVQLFTSKYKLGLTIKMDSERLDSFLERFAKDPSKSLYEKYGYISLSRLPAVGILQRTSPSAEFSPIERIQEGVKERVTGDIERISKDLRSLAEWLSECQQKAEEKYRKRGYPLFWFAQPETITTLQACKILGESGCATSVYREFRKILEVKALGIFIDFLHKNSLRLYKGSGIEGLMIPWLDRNFFAIMKEIPRVGISNFDRKLNDLFDREVRIYLQILGIEMSKTKFLELFTQRLSYPLFVALFGILLGEIEREKIRERLSPYCAEERLLTDLASRNLSEILARCSRKKRPTKMENKVSKAISSRFCKDKIAPPWPTIEFVIWFVEKVSGMKIRKLYSEYSTFVHVYPETFQISPFCSVLEFKILREEIQKFLKRLEEITIWYSSNVFSP